MSWVEGSSTESLVGEQRALYGTVHQSEGNEEAGTTTEKRLSGLRRLAKSASYYDIFLMLNGILFSMVSGASMPCLGIVFGQMTNTLMDVTKKGFKNSTFYKEGYLINDALSVSSVFKTSEEIEDGITVEEFLRRMNTYVAYYFLIALFTFLATFLQTLCCEYACERVIQQLRRSYLAQVLRQDITWFDQNQKEDLNSKLSDDIERIKEGVGIKFAMVTQFISTFLSGVLVGLYVDWRLTLSLSIVGPFILWTTWMTNKMTSGSAQREQLKYSIASGIAVEILNCIRIVAAFGGVQKELKRYEVAVDDGRKLVMEKYHFYSRGLFLTQLALYSGYGFGLCMACYYINAGYSTPGSAFTVFFSMMLGSFNAGSIQQFTISVSTANGVAKNVFEVIDRVPEIDPYSTAGIVPTQMEGRIVLDDVSFSYPSRQEVEVLTGTTLVVEPGQTIAIVGSSGTGKSTIINLIMRFYDTTSGQILIDGRNIKKLNLKWLRKNIGWVSQEPILFGVSISENIRYGRENVTMEEVKAAALLANAHSFIEELPQGYNTLVGERGTQLSGGQKQRIAIARALVRQPKILLLDEATSALDAQSEGVVQEALENAAKGRTTIIVAHRLSTIKNAHLIYVMKEGKVVESGNHGTLMELKQTYYQLVTSQVEDQNEKKTMGGVVQESPAGGSAASTSPKTLRVTEDDETFQSGDKNEFMLVRIIKLNSREWFLILVGLLTCSLAGIVQPMLAFYFGEVFATFSMEGEQMERRKWLWTELFVLLGVVSGVAYWLWTLTMASSAEYLIARVRCLVMENVLKQEISWFDHSDFSVSKIITRLARDAPILKSIAGPRIGVIVNSVVGFSAALIITIIYGPHLVLLMLLVFLAIFLASYQNVKLLMSNALRDITLMDNAGKVASESIQNVRTVQALGRELRFTRLYMEYLRLPFRESKKQAFRYSLYLGLSQAALYFMYSATFYFSSSYIVDKYMSPDDLFKVFFAFSLTAVAVGNSSAYLMDYGKAVASCKSLFQIMDKESKANPLDANGLKPELKGAIKFNNACFSYPMRKDVSVLDHFDLEINAGETVALVGESGCGKSTVLSLLERFYDLNDGEILVDGIDIQSINLSYLRSNIGLVTQEPVLFDCSIKENILYGTVTHYENPTDQEVYEVAKMSNIHDFICTLPQGYDTLCGAMGTQLSGGQKQRIAIARALLRDPKILLLDEATSALDTENEKIVQDALDKARRGRTTIVIAHRLSTIQNADKIAVIQNGRIVEEGKHNELKERQGIYYDLIKRQQL